MKNKFFRDISASSLQVIITQLSGLIIFYITSKWLDKKIFGELNWSLALLMVSFAVLGCGIDQIAVRKTAAGNNVSDLLKAYLFHVIATGFLFIGILLIIRACSNAFREQFNLLLLLGIGQFFIFVSLPFKQIANGKEQFPLLLIMSTMANMFKVTALFVLAYMGHTGLWYFAFIYTIAAAIELATCFYLGKRSLQLSISIKTSARKYKQLIRESLPQLGVTIVTSAIARFDWILLGLISTSVILAEYSFAYKAFELSTLPLLIIAPLLLPRITKLFTLPDGQPDQQKEQLFTLSRLEIALSCLLSLILTIGWSPLIDGITNNKYGVVNIHTIIILSCAVPFLYVNNILWAVNFAQKRMKFIVVVFFVSFLITCAGDLLLIPFFRGEGAAIAYLAAVIIQTIHFTARTQIEKLTRIWICLFLSGGSALLTGFLVKYISGNAWIQAFTAVAIYILLICFFKQLKFSDRMILKGNFLQAEFKEKPNK